MVEEMDLFLLEYEEKTTKTPIKFILGIGVVSFVIFLMYLAILVVIIYIKTIGSLLTGVPWW